MESDKGVFMENNIEKYSIGSGIIPVAIDNSGNIKVLLAKERYVQQWKGSYRWSGFEGARKDNERTADTAIRELSEEGLDIVSFDKPIYELIKEKKYVMRIVINIYQDKPNLRYHSTYLVQTNWAPEWIGQFKEMRTNLVTVHTLCEKLKEYSLSNTVYPGMEIDGQGKIVTIYNYTHVNGYMYININVKNEENVKQITHKKIYCDKFKNWFDKRKELQKYIQNFSHKAILAEYDDNNLVLTAHVQDDYMEKEKIQWWSLKDLNHVISSKGIFFNEQFRPYFMPVLQTLVQELTKYDTRYDTNSDTRYSRCVKCK